jgi:hypothetical protein
VKKPENLETKAKRHEKNSDNNRREEQQERSSNEWYKGICSDCVFCMFLFFFPFEKSSTNQKKSKLLNN